MDRYKSQINFQKINQVKHKIQYVHMYICMYDVWDVIIRYIYVGMYYIYTHTYLYVYRFYKGVVWISFPHTQNKYKARNICRYFCVFSFISADALIIWLIIWSELLICIEQIFHEYIHENYDVLYV